MRIIFVEFILFTSSESILYSGKILNVVSISALLSGGGKLFFKKFTLELCVSTPGFSNGVFPVLVVRGYSAKYKTSLSEQKIQRSFH